MAGFVLYQLGRLPEQGEVLRWRDLTIEVVDMDGLVIDKLLVQKRPLGDDGEPADDDAAGAGGEEGND
jgi:putative hemolysin